MPFYLHAPIKEMREKALRWEERWWTARSVRSWLVTVLLTSGSLAGKGNQSIIKGCWRRGRPPTSATKGLASTPKFGRLISHVHWAKYNHESTDGTIM